MTSRFSRYTVPVSVTDRNRGGEHPCPATRSRGKKNIRLVTEVALDCFLANGIEKTKVADIALRSGLTERSVFRYFETKADLVLAASLLY